MEKVGIYENRKRIGGLLYNGGMTPDAVYEAAGIKIAHTEDDYNGMPENGMHDFDELEIREER